jgi:hypothetical protein
LLKYFTKILPLVASSGKNRHTEYLEILYCKCVNWCVYEVIILLRVWKYKLLCVPNPAQMHKFEADFSQYVEATSLE